jgi:uncharacterized membrane protein (UPF0127 family)
MTLIKKPGRRALLALSLWGLAFLAQAQPAGEPQRLPTITLGAGIHNSVAQVAQSDSERQVGLMFRKEMPAHEGMIFVFEQAAMQCFWMRNTLIPLSAAFIADDGSIVNIERMAPKTDESHCSRKPVRFVLEMNAGWFEKNGIKPGAKLTGAPFGR